MQLPMIISQEAEERLTSMALMLILNDSIVQILQSGMAFQNIVRFLRCKSIVYIPKGHGYHSQVNPDQPLYIRKSVSSSYIVLTGTISRVPSRSLRPICWTRL